jgi:streptogramin lyase
MRKILLALTGLCGTAPFDMAMAAPATITLPDKNVFPESMTATPDNVVIVGSMLQPYIYRAMPGQTVAERWIDLTSVGSTSWGVLADVKSNTLWTCTVAHPLTDTMTPPIKERHSALRAFDLKSGAAKASYPLLGDTNACNDITVAPDGTVYVSDLANGQIQRLKKGAAALDVWSKTPESANIDGITFLGPVLYFSNVQTGHIYRLPIGADGAAGAPVDIALPQPLGGPDGVRAWNGKLYVAENRTNQVSELTITGDSAMVKVLKGGFQTATGVAPTRDTVWVEESKQNYWRAPLLGSDPNPFIIQPVAMPK